MAQVYLSLPLNDAGNTEFQLAVSLSENEELLLRDYVRLMQRVRAAAWLQRGMGGFKGMSLDASGLRFTASECSDAELFELLHLLRPVTLARERSSFQRTAAVLGRRIEEPNVRGFLKLCQRIFRDGEMALYMQVTLADQPLFDESLLDTWLNGTQYHTDAEKERTWLALEDSLSAPSCRALVISQLHSKVLALLNIDHIANQVLSALDA
jgi:hypothetical protein